LGHGRFRLILVASMPFWDPFVASEG
jgi:hypothetical protein